MMREIRRMLSVSLLGVLGVSSVTLADVDATLAWSNRMDLATPLAGVVERVEVQEGALVARGDELAALAVRHLRAAVQRYEAEVVSARLQREEAQRERQRNQELYDRASLADHTLQMAVIGDARAEAELRAAQARLAEARHQLALATVRAPFDAVVVRRYVVPGQVVNGQLVAAPLISVAEAGYMVAKGHLDAARLNDFTRSAPIEVVVGERRYSGEVVRVAMEPSEQGGHYGYAVEVRFAHDHPPGVLRAGLAARIRPQ